MNLMDRRRQHRLHELHMNAATKLACTGNVDRMSQQTVLSLLYLLHTRQHLAALRGARFWTLGGVLMAAWHAWTDGLVGWTFTWAGLALLSAIGWQAEQRKIKECAERWRPVIMKELERENEPAA